MDAGDLIDLDVTAVAHGGVFVARHEGRVVFVSDAVPGERVRARLSDVGKASFWRAETVEVLDASPDRQEHVWPEADVAVPPERRAGGADFGHIRPTRQRALKLDVVTEAFERFAGGAVPTTIVPAGADETPDGTRWRTRVGLHVDGDGRVGPFAARSHSVVEVDSHPLATAAIEAAALRIAGGPPGRVELVQPADGEVRVLRRHASRRAPGRRGPGRSVTARETVTERVGARAFQVDADGFWQVHRSAAAVLDGAVRRALLAGLGDRLADADAWHLDLYGGVGLLAASLAESAAPGSRVTTVETDRRATAHAAANLADLGADAVTSHVDRYLAQVAQTASDADRAALGRGAVVLDPPRAGAGRGVVAQLVDLAPAAIVYVACDPVALARDVGTFREHGYDTQSVSAFDLFPNSHHVEAVALLTPEAR